MTDAMVGFDPRSLEGMLDEKTGIEILNTPHWHSETKSWRALANVNGALAVVEFQIRVLGPDEKSNLVRWRDSKWSLGIPAQENVPVQLSLLPELLDKPSPSAAS